MWKFCLISFSSNMRRLFFHRRILDSFPFPLLKYVLQTCEMKWYIKTSDFPKLVKMKESKVTLKHSSVQNIFIHSVGFRKSEIEYYAMLAKTGVHHYNGNNIELGTSCGKYFRVTTLSITDPGMSNTRNKAIRWSSIDQNLPVVCCCCGQVNRWWFGVRTDNQAYCSLGHPGKSSYSNVHLTCTSRQQCSRMLHQQGFGHSALPC